MSVPGNKWPIGWILAGVGCLGAAGVTGTVGLAGIVWYVNSGGSSSGAPNPSRRASSGILSGTVRDESGKPIAIPGAKILISVTGISERSGERVSYRPPVNASGAYSAKVVPGLYHPINAEIEVSFNGATYLRDLHPVQANESDRPSGPGIIQDFVWKVSGAHFRYIQNPNPAAHTNWHGGSVHVRLSGYRNDLSRGVQPPPVGTRYVFTLTPVSKRIDGAPAKVMTFERTWASSRELDNGLLYDIPVAVYSLTGVQAGEGGGPLVFETSYAKYEPQMKIDFPATDVGRDPALHIVAFDRQ